jgi:hypothetical protein
VEKDVVKVGSRFARSGRGRLRASEGADRLDSSAVLVSGVPPGPPLSGDPLGGRMIDLRLPSDVQIIFRDRGPVLRGPGLSLFMLAQELRHMAVAVPGAFAELPGLRLVVQESPPKCPRLEVVCLPNQAWNILASKFAEVATGREESPLYFGDCGYLYPHPTPDLGVELEGPPFCDQELTGLTREMQPKRPAVSPGYWRHMRWMNALCWLLWLSGTVLIIASRRGNVSETIGWLCFGVAFAGWIVAYLARVCWQARRLKN